MLHERQRKKTEDALTLLIFRPLFAERERLRQLGIPINPTNASQYAADRARPIIQQGMTNVITSNIDGRIDEAATQNNATLFLLPALLSMVASDISKSFAIDRPLRATSAIERGITLTTRIINLAEIFSSTDVVNELIRQGLETDAERTNPPTVDYADIVSNFRWITELDRKVCAICSPLHQRLGIHWIDRFPFGPPAHRFCRCELQEGWPRDVKGMALFRIIRANAGLTKTYRGGIFANELLAL